MSLHSCMIRTGFPLVSLPFFRTYIIDFEHHDHLVHIFYAQYIYFFLAERTKSMNMQAIGISLGFSQFRFFSINFIFNIITYQQFSFDLKLLIKGHHLSCSCSSICLVFPSSALPFIAVKFHINICARNHSHHIRLVKVVKRRFTSH